MPFIRVKTSCPISGEQERELKTRMGKAIGLVPGKTEAYLLLGFEDNCRLWLRGSHDEAIAYIEAAVFGNEVHAGYPAFTAEVTRAFQDVLGVRPENCYIRFEDIPAWSVAGQYIDRGMYR